jgi:soluble epoxide hydrolase / lipid-phosphate phosphatase
MVVWRTVLWYPELISHVFSVCTPYNSPAKTFHPLEDIVKRIPHFGYQLQLASGEVEKHVESRDEIRQFLKGMFGGRGPNGEVLFSPKKGILFENLHKIEGSGALSSEVSAGLQFTSLSNMWLVDARVLH